MTSFSVLVPETVSLQDQTTDLIRQVREVVIVDQVTFALAAETLKGCKQLSDAIRQEFADSKRKAHEAHKAIVALESKLLLPVDTAEREIKTAMLKWQAAEDARRRDHEQKLRALARIQDEERRLADAIEAEAEGDSEAAEAILSEPALTPVIRMAPAPKVEGVKTVGRWKAHVTDLRKLVAFVAERPEYLNLITVDMVAANALARSMKDAGVVPGLQFVEEKSIASSR